MSKLPSSADTPEQPGKPMPRVKKRTPRDIAAVVRDATRLGNDEFFYFGVSGQLWSEVARPL
ncbi:TPA: hypothetical protein SMR48_002004 [Pseudomonas putida]|nr:hypothetical protein [Pseudomonas putida]